MMPVVVEGRHPYCSACGASRHISKACPLKNAVPLPSQAAAAETTEVSDKALDDI